MALRALKYIDDLNKAPKFVELMSYYLSDVWDEMVHVCRTSFALSRKWIKDEYTDVGMIPAAEFKEVTNYIFRDAVESVARLWLKAWERFVK